MGDLRKQLKQLNEKIDALSRAVVKIDIVQESTYMLLDPEDRKMLTKLCEQKAAERGIVLE